MLLIEPVAAGHLRELLSFELENRAFFERSINARPAGYYVEEGVAAAIESAVVDSRRDVAFQYVIRDESGCLVGRINLIRVRRAHFHSAELGYRIGERFGGRGYATEAVRLIVGQAFGDLGLQRLEATARPENQGSVTVLSRNGFTQFGRSTRSFELHGQWYDLIHFERRVDD